MDYFGVFLTNFLHFDFIIFVFAGVTAVFYAICLKYARALYRGLHLVLFVPERNCLGEAERRVAAIRESEIAGLHRRETRAYQVFSNFIMIFPLLGILGTVLSLLPLVGILGQEVSANFFAALTSTFWGLVFAIVFKVLDGFLSGAVADNESTVALYLKRSGGEEGQNVAQNGD